MNSTNSQVLIKDALLRSSTLLPCCFDEHSHLLDSLVFAYAREECWTRIAHFCCISRHDGKVRSDVRCQIGLPLQSVQQSRANKSGPALLITSRSLCEMPGPPLRGILDFAISSIHYDQL